MRHQTKQSILSLIAVVMVAILPLSCTSSDNPVEPKSPTHSPAPASSGPTDPEVISFVNLVNSYRASKGLSVLVWDGRVAAVAQAHSQDMIDRNYFGHTDPDGLTPPDRLRAAGIVFTDWGENIAGNAWTGADVFQRWINSPGHLANIEFPNFTHHGVGLVDGMWTHMFVNENTGSAAVISTTAKSEPSK